MTGMICSVVTFLGLLTVPATVCYNAPVSSQPGEIAEVKDRARQIISSRPDRADGKFPVSFTPLRAVPSFNRIMNCISCPKLHAFCSECGEITDLTPDTVCMKEMRDGSRSPSFDQLIDAYRTFVSEMRAVRPASASANIVCLRRVMRMLGYSGSDNIVKLTEHELEKWAAAARDQYQPCTVAGTIQGLHKVTSAAAVKYFASKGMSVAPFPTIRIDGRHAPWKSLTVAQRRQLRDLQFEYFRSPDPRKYLMMTFAWEHGMRRNDVLRLHWSENFIEEDGRMYLDYVANKTGKNVHWPIDEDTWRMVCEARKRMESLKVQRLGSDLDSVLRLRRFRHDEIPASEIWDEMNDDLRRVMGWNTAKAAHNLRKDSTDQIYQHYGIDYAEAFSGDTARILRRSYVGKKRIDPAVINIAKL